MFEEIKHLVINSKWNSTRGNFEWCIKFEKRGDTQLLVLNLKNGNILDIINEIISITFMANTSDEIEIFYKDINDNEQSMTLTSK